MTERYVVGIDFGTLSGRALVVRVRDGAELATAIVEYRRGAGIEVPPDWAVWLPSDYREVLTTAVPRAVRDAGVDPADVIGIAVDVTASTVLPARADGTPLCELASFDGRPHAYPKLWKHHAAQPCADRITRVAAERGEPWLDRYGGRVSSEWQLPKALQVLEEDPAVYAAADLWIEATDWLTWLLCGRLTRSAGAAGYKGLHQDGRYPSEAYLAALNPSFAGFAAKLRGPIVPPGSRVGALTAEAASWTGLPAGIAVAAGNLDAHVTAAAAQAVDPGQLLAIMGTSTCHVLNGDHPAAVPGMGGVVDGGLIEGSWGFEAGQSGVGDIFAWFVANALPGRHAEAAARAGLTPHEYLTEEAAREPIGGHGLVALDWASGNRSVLVDHELSGLIVGLTLSTRPAEIYRALLEATAFGARTIVETFEAAGVSVTEFITAGGLTRNKFLMQMYADVLRRPLSVIRSTQGPALGAAIHAAVAAGAHPDVRTAAAAMGGRTSAAYQPDPAASAAYDPLYTEYTHLHDHFGRGGTDVMHRLRAIRRAAHRRSP